MITHTCGAGGAVVPGAVEGGAAGGRGVEAVGLPLEARGLGAPVDAVAGVADDAGASVETAELVEVVSSMDSTVVADDVPDMVSMGSRSAVADPGREEHAAASPTLMSSAVQPSAVLVFMVDMGRSAAGPSRPSGCDRCPNLNTHLRTQQGVVVLGLGSPNLSLVKRAAQGSLRLLTQEDWTVRVGAMPPRKSLRSAPAEYLSSGSWPDGRLRASAPAEARLAAGMARRLRDGLAERPIRDVARAAELSPQTVVNLLHGATWGDVVSVARLERALGVRLWGTEHVA